MTYASEILKREHESILLGLDVLERMAKAADEVNSDDIMSMVDFLKSFADKCHHGKEEGILFPAMVEAGIPKERGPVGVMLNEHDSGRKYISQMSDTTPNNVFDKNGFITAAHNYVNLMSVHIDKENNVLFPMGDKRIQRDMQKSMLERFERYEREETEDGIHEKAHGFLEYMAAKYSVSFI